jgi:YD repeat-containing protein
MQANHAYDGFNRLTQITQKNAANTTLGTYAYTHDNNGNILTKTENGTTHSFTYDDVNRIITSTDGNQTYSYDKNGNRLTLSGVNNISTDTVDYTYDELNRLTEVKKNGAVAGAYKYNGDGLLVEKTQDGVKTRYY